MNNNMNILPAEWAPQSAIQLTWPHAQTDWAYCLEAITATYVEMTRHIADHERLLIVAPDVERVRKRLNTELDAQSARNISYHQCPTNDTWARDHAFLTLTDNKGNATLLDFHFNGWGAKFEAALDNAINRSLFSADVTKGQYEDHLDFVLEGGSVESDGEGTIFTTSQCLLAPHRNQPMDREAIGRELARRLHARRIVWLDYGNLIGDDTDGHIDTIVRVAPGHTLLYIYTDNPADPHYNDLQSLRRQLEGLRREDGQPYRLRPLPLPDPILDDEGNQLPATYANFLITNRKVLVPTYAQPANDALALHTIGQVFADREVVGIDSRTIILQHGSIHCCTMQYPEGVVER